MAFLEAQKEPERIRGRRVAVILSGGNVDAEVFAKVLAEGVGGLWRDRYREVVLAIDAVRLHITTLVEGGN